MLKAVVRASLFLGFVCAAINVPVRAADSLYRSGFETSICNDISVFSEFEPNDALPESNALVLTNGNALVCGQITGGFDVDFFQVSLVNSQTLIVEMVEADGSPCVADLSVPARITLYNPAFAQIATDNSGGVAGCASLDGITNPLLQMLPAGKYYIKVDSPGVYVPAYTLRVSAL